MPSTTPGLCERDSFFEIEGLLFNATLGLRSPYLSYSTVDFSENMAAEQDKVAAGEQTTPGYTVFDFYLQTNRINLGSLRNRFVFGIQNITNRAYRCHLSTYRGLFRLEPGHNFLIRWMLDF